MDKVAIEHWSPVIGSQFWWTGVIFVLFFVPFMLIIGGRMTSKQRDVVLFSMGIYQIGNKVISQITYILSDNYILATNLPLHLCGLSGILAGIVVFYRKQLLFEFLYFFGLVGFIHSVLTPEFTGGTSYWNIFDYYVGHSMLFIIPAWLMKYYDFRLRTGAWWTSFIYLQLIVVLIMQLNIIIGNGANYMYLAKAPIANNPLILQDPYHIVGFEIFALLHFYILDLVARRIFK
tara:strand:+ start:1322 stop:2020 length:699 start_codon:yes stop_codon:yes gene_type:complete